ARLPFPAHADITDASLGGVPCELTTPRTPAQDEFAGGAVPYLHGGAVLFGGPPTPRALRARPSSQAGAPVYSEGYRPPPAAAGRFAGGAVLSLRGGAFRCGGPPAHRALCARLSSQAGVPVSSVEYRQLPDGPVAASVADAIAAYTALLDEVDDPSRIVVAGD